MSDTNTADTNMTDKNRNIINRGMGHTVKYKGEKALLCKCKCNRSKKSLRSAEIKIYDDTSVEEMVSHDESCYVKNGLRHEFDVLHDFT